MNPTKKQFEFIKKIEASLQIKFKGKTLNDADEFIKENLVKYNIEEKYNGTDDFDYY